MLWRFLQKIEPTLIKVYHRISEPPSPNLKGDRDIEWSFVASNIGWGPGKVLDFGCGSSSYLGLIAAQAGYQVISLDLELVDWDYRHPNLRFRRGDILNINFPEKSFDLIINCSSIEHIGLAGRYGVKNNQPNGDIEAMAKMKKLLKTEGEMLLTIPIGQDAVFPPFHRVYGKKRLQKLLNGFIVEKKEYWIKNKDNQWITVDEEIALNREPKKTYYGLGCFVLRPKIN